MSGSSKRKRVDFVLICALEVERMAVCRAFKLSYSDRITREERRYWQGWFQVSTDRAFSVVVAQLSDTANVSAAAQTTTILSHWKPQALLLIGIAAAANRSQRLGDVVVGKSVYYYELGKVVSGGTLLQPDMIRADPELLHSAKTARTWSGFVRTRRPDASKVRAQREFGVVASGEKVVSDSKFRATVVRASREIRALEMEGYGFSSAAFNSPEPVRHLVIRGLCDYADHKKGDTWHVFASASAAAYARHLLSDCPLEPRDRRAKQQASVSSIYRDLPSSNEPNEANDATQANIAELVSLASDIAQEIAAATAAQESPEILQAALAIPRYHLIRLQQMTAELNDWPRDWRHERVGRFYYTDTVEAIQDRVDDLIMAIERMTVGDEAAVEEDPVDIAEEIYDKATDLQHLLNDSRV